MEVTKWLKPSISVSRIGDRASVQAATRVNAEQASKRTMCRPANLNFADFGGATGGTVTVLSETLGTPLPAALPLFGSGVAGLAGFAWKRRKVSVSARG